MIEVVAGCARERAEARQGSTLERSFGGADACHRNVDYPLLRVACQQDFRERPDRETQRMLRRLEPLWDVPRPSILDHVRAHLPDDDLPGPAEGGDTVAGRTLRDRPARCAGSGRQVRCGGRGELTASRSRVGSEANQQQRLLCTEEPSPTPSRRWRGGQLGADPLDRRFGGAKQEAHLRDGVMQARRGAAQRARRNSNPQPSDVVMAHSLGLTHVDMRLSLGR